MDTRTLEQVIMDASVCDSVEAKIIADAVREWAEPMERLRSKHEQSQEAEVADACKAAIPVEAGEK